MKILSNEANNIGHEHLQASRTDSTQLGLFVTSSFLRKRPAPMRANALTCSTVRRTPTRWLSSGAGVERKTRPKGSAHGQLSTAKHFSSSCIRRHRRISGSRTTKDWLCIIGGSTKWFSINRAEQGHSGDYQQNYSHTCHAHRIAFVSDQVLSESSTGHTRITNFQRAPLSNEPSLGRPIPWSTARPVLRF
jgi:hypothetical protein